jgi:pimeloyl-ACP methyl ester carboxylesterase
MNMTAARDVDVHHGRAWVDPDETVRIGYTVVAPPEPTKTVVLLHGAPQTRYEWRKVMVPLAAAGYRVVMPDYRGAGASDKPRDGYDKWTMAGDIHSLVRKTLRVAEPISLVGHDLGSTLALSFALRYRAGTTARDAHAAAERARTARRRTKSIATQLKRWIQRWSESGRAGRNRKFDGESGSPRPASVMRT